MKPSLQLRQTQQLALTPQLQQSIRLLQLSTLELTQEVEQALADNPLLERLDDPLADCVRVAASGALDGRASSAPADDTASERDGETGDAQDWSAEPWDSDAGEQPGGERGADAGRTLADDDERDFPQLACATISLREHLGEQLAATHCTPRDRALVQLLIDALDDDGLLESSPAEVARMLPEELGVSCDELVTALRLLQSFDPAGVGASDLRECLLLQLGRRMGETATKQSPASLDALRLAQAIVDRHLEALASKDYARLRRALRCDDDALREAHAAIRQLDPRPGAAFATQQAGFVVPDVIARRVRGNWIATLNPSVMPRLRINDAYARILKHDRRSAAPQLSGQLQEARWLIRNLQQRFETILRVAQAIVDRQRSFFSHGAVAMRPLVLREIADALGLHESTISRVTSHKYIMTPFGTYELKYFFGSRLATDSGGAASSTAIRAIIRQLVEAESPADPLPDGRIAELLAAQGFVVARRTVAKYRESLRIPTVSKRKSL
ncbi:MAG: RNA polymerase factor sigma-54 [Burkholderiaceae bacterium]|nr:RNA polymerase factor sigma-54 [Burkholderiaceae bacterium]